MQYTSYSDNANTSINPPSTPGVIRETEYTAKRSDEFDPEWSPDGKQLVFSTDRHYRVNPGMGTQKTVFELYKLTYSSSFGTAPTLTRLTHNLGGASSSAPVFNGSTGNSIFSSDGQKILFESSGAKRIYSIPASALALLPEKWTALSPENSNDTSPTYAPGSGQFALSRNGNIVSLSDARQNSNERLIIKEGVQPSWGHVITVTPVDTPTPRPTTTPTTRPTTTLSLRPKEFYTSKRVSDSQTDVFQGIGITGDHEIDGSTLIQAFGVYSINGIPAGATITSAALELSQIASNVQGNPFGTLGKLYVEGDTLPGFAEGALASDAVLVAGAPRSSASLDVTAQVRRVVAARARDQVFVARLRFEKPRNNNGKNDNADARLNNLRITYTR